MCHQLKNCNIHTSEKVELIQLPDCDTIPKEAAMTTTKHESTTAGEKIGILIYFVYFQPLVKKLARMAADV